MLDFSQVTRFEHRLRNASEVPFEDEWQDEWGPRTAAEVSASAPRRTGRLASSVRYAGDGDVEIGAPYWVYVERGTSHMPPQPFVRPTVNRILPRATADAGRRAVQI